MRTAGGSRVGSVLFLSARVGEGHKAAAGAVRTHLAAYGMRGEVVDSYRYAAWLFAKVVSDGYIGMVRTIPQFYGFIYDRAERAPVAGGFRVWASAFTARNIRGLIARMQPSVVVCTHAFPCGGVMAAYKREFDPQIPVLGIVTDFVVHPFWIYPNIDAYAVATPEIRATMIERGIDPAAVEVDGIPVDARFGVHVDRVALRERLGLPAAGFVALVMGGGLGLGPVAAAVRALARARSGVTAVVIAGKNRALERSLREAAQRDGSDVRVLGFVDDVPDWMRAADVLVTKPGGVTTSEALAAGTPLVLLRPLPGQEERNAAYLVSRGAALRARDDDDLVRAVESIRSDEGIADRLRRAAAELARPHAADRIAQRVAALSGRTAPSVALLMGAVPTGSRG